MSMLIAGIVLFFAAHLVRAVAPGFRERMLARLGRNGWAMAVSVLSVAGLVLMVKGYAGLKPYSPWLWTLPVWTRHLAATLMLPALVLLFSAYVPGRIRTAVRHPMTVAVIVWSAAHLLANGQLVDVLFFGSFLVWGVVVAASAFSRPAGARTGRVVFDLVAVILGFGVWGWLAFHGHRLLFGVPVFS